MFELPYINGVMDLWYILFRLVDTDRVILALHVQLFEIIMVNSYFIEEYRTLKLCILCKTIGNVVETLQLLRNFPQD